MEADEPGGGPFRLPPAVPVTRSLVDAIASRHGVEADRLEPLASPGIINTVYRLGQELVLRVPRDHEGHIAQAYREACAIPAAVACGVRTPRLVAFDDSREILPVPFLIVEGVEGSDAESLGVERPPPSGTWASVGADLARLHRSAPPALPPPEPWMLTRHGPRELVEARAREGWVSAWEARRLLDWLERLAPLRAAPSEVFVHGDLQMANVLVHPVTLGYQAVVDWGNAYVGDPNDDLSGAPSPWRARC